MENGLFEKTGKSLAHWIQVVEATALVKHKAIIDFLKSEHGLTYGFANFVAHKFKKTDAASQDDADLLMLQYQGKENLRPIYDLLIEKIKKLGNDITQTPKKTAVSLIRKYQFALIKPATKKRIDLGLKLKGKATSERLGDSGPFGTMCTHRVQLTKLSDVDDELEAWLKEAYEKSI